jgi:hypothetical protein
MAAFQEMKCTAYVCYLVAHFVFELNVVHFIRQV